MGLSCGMGSATAGVEAAPGVEATASIHELPGEDTGTVRRAVRALELHELRRHLFTVFLHCFTKLRPCLLFIVFCIVFFVVVCSFLIMSFIGFFVAFRLVSSLSPLLLSHLSHANKPLLFEVITEII